MRIAVFSDVHGNLTGLRSVLDHIEKQSGIDHIVFAGDACLFGPRPLECVNELLERDIHCLAGNVDHWLLYPPPLDEDLDEANRSRRIHIGECGTWTLEKLDRRAISWIERLQSSFEWRFSPTVSSDDDLLIVHANPQDLLQVIFPSEENQRKLYGRVRQSDGDLEPLLKGTSASMIAFGHLHVPGRRVLPNITLANISSVSIPGDSDPRAKYAIISWDEDRGWDLEYHRVSYSWQDELLAFEESQPPGWENSVRTLKEHGLIAQVV